MQLLIIELKSQACQLNHVDKVAKATSTSDSEWQNASRMRGNAYKKVLLDVVLACPVHDREKEANDVQPAVARPFRPGPA